MENVKDLTLPVAMKSSAHYNSIIGDVRDKGRDIVVPGMTYLLQERVI